jgi:tRNA(Ser,Leu) C12 N-acetylase TAN1
MDHNKEIAREINNHHQFAVQFDRRNSKDFKCYTVGTKEFSDYIEKETDYTEPDPFKYTDIVTLCQRITGVNLSIGYYNEHNENEILVLSEWKNTLDLCRVWLKKPYLPEFLRNI